MTLQHPKPIPQLLDELAKEFNNEKTALEKSPGRGVSKIGFCLEELEEWYNEAINSGAEPEAIPGKFCDSALRDVASAAATSTVNPCPQASLPGPGKAAADTVLANLATGCPGETTLTGMLSGMNMANSTSTAGAVKKASKIVELD